ncbi:RHS repeat-associated core domain-containing protein, partial [Fluviicola sp.]|uniref:RHS repeat-associated core domain-containing protein n=1 Tax=Fluviicola sp. TaxID=1917219 RepID=UPI00262D9D04
VNCVPNPTATAYGYLPNFPTPVAAENAKYYDAAYWYQKNGNFITLNRNNNIGQRMQQLYSYQTNTNKLTQASFQFTNGTPALYNYTYDGNGNLLTDPRNDVNNITYSFFDDLPTSITKTNTSQSIYRYFRGARSVKEYSDTDKEYYIDQIILDQNGVVKSYQTAAGYSILVNGKMQYHYQLKDWVGSTRITLDNGGVIENAIDYYPYGKTMPAREYYSTNQEGYRYGYTGHELDGVTGYQYHGARYYDQDLARYMSVDPLAMQFHAWSTYNYVMGNPIMLTDPTGMGPQGWVGKVNENGNTVWEYRENVNSASQLPEGYTEFAPDGTTIQSTDGSYYRLGKGSADPISATDFKASHGVFEAGKYYKLGNYGWEEAGVVQVGAVSAMEAATTEFLFQQWQGEFMAEDFRSTHWFDYYLQEQGRLAQLEKLKYDFARTQNIFGLMYEISPASSIPDIAGNIQTGSYWTAGGIAALELTPFDEVADAIRANKRAFRSFKSLNGSAGVRMEWHHVVEQHADNVLKFGHEVIQNSDNLIRLDVNLHRLVTGHYNSRGPEGFSRVRDYVKTLSFNEQREYGLKIMRQVGWKP